MAAQGSKSTTSIDQRKVLQQSDTRFRILLEKTKYAVALFDRDSDIFYISPAIEYILGYTPNEYIQMESCFNLLHPDDKERSLATFTSLFETPNESSVVEHRARHKDGTYRWLEVTYTNFLDEADVTAFVASFRDINERKQAEEIHQELLAREQKALAKVEVQQHHFSSVLMEAPAVINVFKGPEHVFDFVNAEFLALLGDRQFLGKPVREAQPELAGKGIYELLDMVYRTGEPFFGNEISVPVVTPNGTTQRYYNFMYQPTRDACGQIDGIVSFAFDVSQQVLARQKVEEREEQYRFLANAMPQQVWTAMPDGTLDYVNQQTVDYFERSADDIIGAGWQNFLHPDDLPSCLHAWQRALQTGQRYQIEFRLRAGDGTYKWHLGRALPLMSNERIVKWFGTNTDIHEYKKLQAQKDEFISMASHELRTPMTTIKAWTQIQKKRFEKQGIEEVVHSFTKMETQINKVNRLIADLLDISKMQVGKLSYMRDDISLDAIVHESVEMVQQMSPTHIISIYGSADKHIVGDKDRLEQVFTNLLNNAIKYSPNATMVDVSIETMQDQVFVKVRDYGIGIPHEHQGKIFDRFYRVSDGASQLFPGLGMGLYLACEVVVRHGGDIEVESEEGKGSTFIVTLPLKNELMST
ncbi:MAG: hypothetical protein PVS3B3_26850 [Ktedonobacteraceae bacterium]